MNPLATPWPPPLDAVSLARSGTVRRGGSVHGVRVTRPDDAVADVYLDDREHESQLWSALCATYMWLAPLATSGSLRSPACGVLPVCLRIWIGCVWWGG